MTALILPVFCDINLSPSPVGDIILEQKVSKPSSPPTEAAAPSSPDSIHCPDCESTQCKRSRKGNCNDNWPSPEEMDGQPTWCCGGHSCIARFAFERQLLTNLHRGTQTPMQVLCEDWPTVPLSNTSCSTASESLQPGTKDSVRMINYLLASSFLCVYTS